ASRRSGPDSDSSRSESAAPCSKGPERWAARRTPRPSRRGRRLPGADAGRGRAFPSVLRVVAVADAAAVELDRQVAVAGRVLDGARVGRVAVADDLAYARHRRVLAGR